MGNWTIVIRLNPHGIAITVAFMGGILTGGWIYFEHEGRHHNADEPSKPGRVMPLKADEREHQCEGQDIAEAAKRAIPHD